MTHLILPSITTASPSLSNHTNPSRTNTILQDDLLTHHKHHFDSPFTGALPDFTAYDTTTNTNLQDANHHEAEHEYENYETYADDNEYDDGLGYYPDGVKRTLTDVQIEIFRHSEVQRALLRQVRQAEAQAEAVTAAEEEIGEYGDVVVKMDVSSQDGPTDVALEAKTEEVDGSGEGGYEDAEYVRFLEEESKQFAIDAERKRAQVREKQLSQQNEANDRSVSTRRKVRELDEMMAEKDVVLDY